MGEKWMVTKRRPFDSVARMSVKKRLFRKGEATCMIHERFLAYLAALPEEERETIQQQLVDQQWESVAMRLKKGHPFHGDEEGFDRHCRVKYKLLHDHIIRMIDQMIEERAK